MNEHYFVAIMAGGVGSRFWPSSRESRPKQFLDITNSGKSLLQQTVDRLSRIVLKQNILIVSNKKYKAQILEQLPMIGESQLLLEPSRNNTAPCVAYTALHLQARNQHAVFAMLPADHIIKDVEAFQNALLRGFRKAEKTSAIVTLGIQPTRPDTGYGYIHFESEDLDNDVHKVISFKEKPSREKALRYIESGDYLWNAGIFIWSVSTIIDAFESSAPDILTTLCRDKKMYGSAEEQAYIDDVYPETRNISVDFAILERAENVFTIPVEMGWSDLGTWNSLYDYLKNDHQQNVLLTEEVLCEDAKGNLIKAPENKLIVIRDLNDFIIVDEGDVLLIYPRKKEQDIKQLKSKINDPRFE